MDLPIISPSPHPSDAVPSKSNKESNTGINPDASTLRFRVRGMTCAGCAAGIQQALEKRPEVSQASVSFASGTAEVVGVDLQATKLSEVIAGRGFQAELLADHDSFHEQSEVELRQNAHERTWRYRAIVGVGLWIPLEVSHWIANAWHLHGPWMNWFMFAGAFIVILFAGSEFYKSAWQAAIRRATNMDTLISIGATTAFVYSTIVLFFRINQPMYFAEASGLLGIVSLGHWFEARASALAGSAVRELLRLQPESAERWDVEGGTELVSTADVQVGWKLQVRPGGRIAVDGVVLEGQSAVDQSIVTGESIPVDKRPGDRVIAGSMNTTGRLIMEATVDGRNTTVNRIAQLVQKAQASRAPIQRVADQVSAIFVPSVLVIAALTALGWWIAGDLARGVISAVTVLIISCPCALGLATPMAIMVGTGAASRQGILIRNAETLELLGRARHVVFDKTGTLTVGQPTLSEVQATPGYTSDAILRLAAAVEAPSEHPIAKAIVAEAKARGLAIPRVQDFVALPGRGVQGMVEGQMVLVDRDEEATARVLVDDLPIGKLVLKDQLRGDAVTAISALNRQGMTVSILSGDRIAAALAIADELGVAKQQVVAEATPASKASHIQSLGKETIMVGDGLNDAAALASSGLGVALASGTNVAIEAASVVIPGDRVQAIPELIDLSRMTLRTIKQSIFFAFFYNGLAIPLAALGLLGESGPLWAALAMGASDITVVGNALWLKQKLQRMRSR